MTDRVHQITIYDRTAGCACRPGEQRGMMVLHAVLYGIRKEYGDRVSISYFTLDRNKDKFEKNSEIKSLIDEKGLEILPVTIVNGKVCKTGENPTLAELRELLES